MRSHARGAECCRRREDLWGEQRESKEGAGKGEGWAKECESRLSWDVRAGGVKAAEGCESEGWLRAVKVWR